MRHLVTNKIFNRPSISCHITFMCLVLAIVGSINVAALGQCELQTIWSPDGGPEYVFGFTSAASASMDVFIIGEFGYNNYRGAAHIYRSDGNSWEYEAMLEATDGPQFGAHFGRRADMSADGKTILVSESLDANNGFFDVGAVWVYVEVDGKWTVQQKLVASDAQDEWVFGEQLALSADGNVAAISATGAPWAPVYVFTREGNKWTEAEKLQDDVNNFGLPWLDVSADGSVIVVGANDDPELGQGAGAIYIFESNGGKGPWLFSQKLLASDGEMWDNFGFGISLSATGDTILAGAVGDDDAANHAGAAYVFQRVGEMWFEQVKLLADDAIGGENFGAHTKLTPDGHRALINSGNNSVYVYDYVEGEWIETMRLTASDPDVGILGKAISITDDGSTALLGAPNSRVDGVLWFGAAALFDIDAPLGDLNCDGSVSTADLLTLLSNWGSCGDCEFYGGCLGDLNLDCTVGTSDLLILLSNWG